MKRKNKQVFDDQLLQPSAVADDNFRNAAPDSLESLKKGREAASRCTPLPLAIRVHLHTTTFAMPYPTNARLTIRNEHGKVTSFRVHRSVLHLRYSFTTARVSLDELEMPRAVHSAQVVLLTQA